MGKQYASVGTVIEVGAALVSEEKPRSGVGENRFRVAINGSTILLTQHDMFSLADALGEACDRVEDRAAPL